MSHNLSGPRFENLRNRVRDEYGSMEPHIKTLQHQVRAAQLRYKYNHAWRKKRSVPKGYTAEDPQYKRYLNFEKWGGTPKLLTEYIPYNRQNLYGVHPHLTFLQPNQAASRLQKFARIMKTKIRKSDKNRMSIVHTAKSMLNRTKMPPIEFYKEFL
jgi:hypothetical protein